MLPGGSTLSGLIVVLHSLISNLVSFDEAELLSHFCVVGKPVPRLPIEPNLRLESDLLRTGLFQGRTVNHILDVAYSVCKRSWYGSKCNSLMEEKKNAAGG